MCWALDSEDRLKEFNFDTINREVSRQSWSSRPLGVSARREAANGLRVESEEEQVECQYQDWKGYATL
jgi:hypothetical protein